MNGIHDLGGMDGFGPVEVETNEPVFHRPWERRVFGLTAGRPQVGNVHEFRHAIERMAPEHYLASSYYEHWLTGLATLLVEKGLLTRAELDVRVGGVFPLSRPVDMAPVAEPDASGPDPRFALGTAVVVRNVHTHGHTRCPRYVRGRHGIVVRVDPAHALPDLAAHFEGRCRQYTYCVRFERRELWGDEGQGSEAVYVDLWEGYLENA